MQGMEKREFDTAFLNNFALLVFIGRFQPFHNGHFLTVQRALKDAHKVLILCGSADKNRSKKNPWNFMEREQMIRSCFDDDKIIVMPQYDIANDDVAWVQSIRNKVNYILKRQFVNKDNKAQVGLIGCRKDDSSYYLNLFPDYTLVEVENLDDINATEIRKNLLLKQNDAVKKYVPKEVYDLLLQPLPFTHPETSIL